MIKKMLPIWIFLFILAGGCGVKTSLTPPDVLVPKAITDLKGTIKEQAFELTWSLPEANVDGSKPVDLVRFQVLRREETRGCLECPGEFLKRAELDLRSPQGYLLEKDTVTWQDRDLKDGVIYMYKVVGINHWGYQGPPSNEVMIRWGSPAPSSSISRHGERVG
jgi:hypothetical protein